MIECGTVIRWYEGRNLDGLGFSVSQQTSCMFLSLLTHTRKFYLMEKRHGDHQASKLASLLLLKSPSSIPSVWNLNRAGVFVCLFVYLFEEVAKFNFIRLQSRKLCQCHVNHQASKLASLLLLKYLC